MTLKRAFLVLFAAAIVVGGAAPFVGAKTQRVEVIEVTGVIDGSVERSVISTIERAQDEGAPLVVIQLSSKGVIGRDRVVRVARAIASSTIPVATWIGPPGAVAANGTVLIATASPIRGMAPGSVLGPVRTLDLRTGTPAHNTSFRTAMTSRTALDKGVVDFVEPTLTDVLTTIGEKHLAKIEIDKVSIRYQKLDLFGRVLHAAAQPSIAYLLLLVGLVGVVFELFHPSTGPAGVSGLAGLAFGLFGIATLGGSWIGVALIVAGVAGFCIDLRFTGLGVFTIAGLGGLIAGSLLLFPSPYLSISPWVLGIGIIGMVMFLLGAMTRVLRDLRAIARGDLEVTEAHSHPEGEVHDA